MNDNELTALSGAIDTGDVALFRSLLGGTGNVNAVLHTEQSPTTTIEPLLYRAVVRNQLAIVRLLLEQGANPNTEAIAYHEEYDQGITLVGIREDRTRPLYEAVTQSDDMVRLLLTFGADVASGKSFGEWERRHHSPLGHALERGRQSVARMLRAANAPLLKDAMPYLMENAKKFADDAFCREMLVPVGEGNTDWNAALCCAIAYKRNTLLPFIGNRTTTVNPPETAPYPGLMVGQHPLWLAAAFGNEEATYWLLLKGADPDKQAERWPTPYMPLALGPKPYDIWYFAHFGMPASPIMVACWHSQVAIVERLLQHGASPSKADAKDAGKTPLYWASTCTIESKRAAMEELLYRYGATS